MANLNRFAIFLVRNKNGSVRRAVSVNQWKSCKNTLLKTAKNRFLMIFDKKTDLGTDFAIY